MFTRTRPDFFRRDMCYLINTLFRRPQRLETKPLTLDLEPQMPPSINSPVLKFFSYSIFFFLHAILIFQVFFPKSLKRVILEQRVFETRTDICLHKVMYLKKILIVNLFHDSLANFWITTEKNFNQSRNIPVFSEF